MATLRARRDTVQLEPLEKFISGRINSPASVPFGNNNETTFNGIWPYSLRRTILVISKNKIKAPPPPPPPPPSPPPPTRSQTKTGINPSKQQTNNHPKNSNWKVYQTRLSHVVRRTRPTPAATMISVTI